MDDPNLSSVNARGVTVEHHDVIGIDLQPARRLVAVIGDVDGDSLVAKPSGDRVRCWVSTWRRNSYPVDEFMRRTTATGTFGGIGKFGGCGNGIAPEAVP
jgi:hypothetical protein